MERQPSARLCLAVALLAAWAGAVCADTGGLTEKRGAVFDDPLLASASVGGKIVAELLERIGAYVRPPLVRASRPYRRTR